MGSLEIHTPLEEQALNSSDPSPTVLLLQRRRAGVKVDLVHQKETGRSATRDTLTALPSPMGETTIKLGLQNPSKTTQETQANKETVEEKFLGNDQLRRPALEIQARGNNQNWLQNAKPDNTSRDEVKVACASTNTTITTGFAQTTSSSPSKRL